MDTTPAAATRSARVEQARVWAPKLKALGDETRLLLALRLAEAPCTVKELQEATGLSQTLVSHHLKPLRQQGLVTMVPQGRSNVYTLCCEECVNLVKGLSTLITPFDQLPGACSS